jgi:hypothetical protein
MTEWVGSDRAKDRTRERPEFRVAWIQTTDEKESDNERGRATITLSPVTTISFKYFRFALDLS